MVYISAIMDKPSSSNKRIAKNSIFMSIRMIIVLVITLYTSRIVLKYLGVEDYGIYNVVAGFITMFGFFNASLSNGIQRFYNYELGKNGVKGANEVYSIAIIIQLILSIVVIIPTEIFGLWYIDNKLVVPDERIYATLWIFQLSLLSFIFHIFQVPYTAAVMAHERMDFYAIMSVINSFLILTGAYLLQYIPGDKLIIYGLSITLISILLFSTYYIYCKKKFQEIKFMLVINKNMFKEMLTFSCWNMFGTFGQMLKDQGVNLLLNLFFGPLVNAARAIATQVNGGLQSLVSNISIPVRPQLIQAYSQGNVKRSLSLTYSISKFSSYLLLLISLPIILEIEYILQIWLGEHIPQYTSSLVIIVILNSFILNLNSAISGLVHATGKMRIYQMCGGSISIISILVIYISLSIIKLPETALIVLLIMDFIRQVIALIILKRLVMDFSLLDYLRIVIIPFMKVSIIGITLPIIFHYNIEIGFIRLLIVSVISFFSILLIIYFLGLTHNEKQLIKPIINKIKNKLIKL